MYYFNYAEPVLVVIKLWKKSNVKIRNFNFCFESFSNEIPSSIQDNTRECMMFKSLNCFIFLFYADGQAVLVQYFDKPLGSNNLMAIIKFTNLILTEYIMHMLCMLKTCSYF